MPLQKLTLKPGLNREGTDYSNEGGWYDGDKIRFRSGYPEKIGGWTRFLNSNNSFLGTARGLWDWVDLASNNYVGVGSNVKYYLNWSGTYYDITPYYASSSLTAAITATNGSSTLTITDGTYTTYAVGDYVVISGATGLGGNITATVLNQEYVITGVGSGNFTITAKNTSGIVVTANSSDTGTGGTFTVNYEIPTGLNVYTQSTGWGVSPWGFGGWGSAYSGASGIGAQLRLWTNDNYGEYLFLAPRGGPIYYWQPSGNYPNGTSGGLSTRAQLVKTQATANGNAGQFVPNSTYQVITSAIQKFVIAFGANSYDPTNANTTFNPMLVRWSDQLNPFQWVPSVTNQSGEFTLTNGSYIMGARATRQEILIWTDSALYSMQYLGAPYIWGFNILMDNISVMSPNSMITINNVTYWMGQEKFYMYSGTVQTLPCSLRQYIYANINQSQSYQVFAGANEGYNEVWWFYCSKNSSVIDSYVIYNYLDQVWYYGTMERTAWSGSGILPNPVAAYFTTNASMTGYISGNTLTITNATAGSIEIGATITGTGITAGTTVLTNGVNNPVNVTYTAGNFVVGNTYTIATLGTTNFVAIGASSNTVGVTFVATGAGTGSGTAYTTASTGLGGVGTYTVNFSQTVGSSMAPIPITVTNNASYLLNHEVGVDDVSGITAQPIDAYVQSSDFDIEDGHNFGFVWRILPDVNFNGSNVNDPYVTMTLKPRQNSGTAYGVADNPQVTSSQNYQTIPEYTVQQFTGQVYTRLRGRQLSFRIESNSLGVAWQLGVPRIDIRKDGRR